MDQRQKSANSNRGKLSGLYDAYEVTKQYDRATLQNDRATK